MPPGGIIVLPPLARPLAHVTINGRNSSVFTPQWAQCESCPADLLLGF